MDLDKKNRCVELETPGEYVAVRYGIINGLKIVERCVELDPPLTQEQIDTMHLEADNMPIRLSREQLPYKITISQAKVALCGIRRLRQNGSAGARELRNNARSDLEKFLKQMPNVL